MDTVRPSTAFWFTSLLAFSALSCSARAQTWITYDAGRGTLPENQCWTRGEDINPPTTYPFGVAGGELHLSTLGFAATGAQGGGVWWQHAAPAIDFAADFAAEVRVRIASAPDHATNPTAGWPRPGYTLTIYDIHGRLFWIGLGSGEIFLSNTAFGQYGSANTVTLAFNTTDAPHVYRIERAGGGVGATLRIDGVASLTLPALGPVEGGAGGLVYFGDPTYWANSESYTLMARFTGVSCVADVDDGSGSGVCDGGVTIDDLIYYLSLFEAGDVAADVDDGSGTGTPDGGVTIDDLIFYLTRFEAGC